MFLTTGCTECSSHVVGSIVISSDVIVKAVGNVVKLCLWKTAHKALVLHVGCDAVLFVPQLSKRINNQTYMYHNMNCRVSWVRIPPRAALLPWKNGAVLGVVDLFAFALLPHFVC